MRTLAVSVLAALAFGGVRGGKLVENPTYLTCLQNSKDDWEAGVRGDGDWQCKTLYAHGTRSYNRRNVRGPSVGPLPPPLPSILRGSLGGA
jgi:hypothetical protein